MNMTITNHHSPARSPSRSVRLAEGAAGAIVGGLVDGVGIGGATLIRTPQLVGKAYCDLWTSEKTLAYKSTTSLIIPAVALLATPLATAVGLAVGAYQGAQEGYANGLPVAAQRSVEMVLSYDQFLQDTLKG